jgi:diguanylate cyclase (GGDEF)-like protein
MTLAFGQALAVNWVANKSQEQLLAQITQLKSEVEKWKNRAERDYLTGCLRRESFMELVSERIKQGWMPSQVTLAVIDLDHFKKINDTYGHIAGDVVLAQVGELLRTALSSQSLVCRAGGEEFVVMIPQSADLAKAELEGLLEKIRSQVANLENGEKIQYTASVGVARWNLDREALIVATAKADAALYEAKKGGRNRVILSQK